MSISKKDFDINKRPKRPPAMNLTDIKSGLKNLRRSPKIKPEKQCAVVAPRRTVSKTQKVSNNETQFRKTSIANIKKWSLPDVPGLSIHDRVLDKISKMNTDMDKLNKIPFEQSLQLFSVTVRNFENFNNSFRY